MVPVDTMTGLLGGDWEAWDEMACSSGALDMMAEARRISDDLGGAEADFAGGGVICFSGLAAGYGLFSASAAGRWLPELGDKASSASLSATFWLRSLAFRASEAEAGSSKLNLVPWSCNNEN